MWHWLREPFEEGNQESRRIQGPCRGKTQWREGTENWDAGEGGSKRKLALEEFRRKFYNTDLLQHRSCKWREEGRDAGNFLPDVLCLFTYCLDFSLHPLLWKNEICLYSVVCTHKNPKKILTHVLISVREVV